MPTAATLRKFMLLRQQLTGPRYVAEGGVFFTYMGEEGQQEMRPREQTIADFKDFLTKFYPANQQQTFIYR
jgi:hypothetical protein